MLSTEQVGDVLMTHLEVEVEDGWLAGVEVEDAKGDLRGRRQMEHPQIEGCT